METAALIRWREKLAEDFYPPGRARKRDRGLARKLRQRGRVAARSIADRAVCNLEPDAPQPQLARITIAGDLGGLCTGDMGALLIPVLLLASAFQPITRPYYRCALRDAMLISFSGPLLSFWFCRG